ncbi:putative Lasso peptide biosynthesis B2 protein [Rubrivivax sp. A210]|uniref:lasso peptide biosynthesis B2 protein n=1 Tax=Rubrivivax sp. A210 TaxID=2772301 RepID=UPI00191B49CA|nr:lasso peptide biosynthesis B2 protein [Rubrivivax sp. A210]CAD5372620.1 putative Lasso peptide biosynthesis B2 protein [Rubrivivax sp. A210]
MQHLRRFLGLTRRRQALLVECGWALLGAAWQVRRWPFSRLADSLGHTGAATAAPKSPHAGADPEAAAAAEAVGGALAAWARVWPWTPTCLMLAVAACRLLRRRGLAGEIVFGVRGVGLAPAAPPATLGAHAWLHCAGRVVTGEAESRAFRPIAAIRFGPGPAARSP